MEKQLKAKCFKCGSEMVNIGNGVFCHFICKNGCSEIGPIPETLLTQEELDAEYELKKKQILLQKD